MSTTWGEIGGLDATLAERESMWFVVTLAPWSDEDEHPELVFWCGGHWSYDRDEWTEVYSHREAVLVADSLTVPPWANGPCLPLNAADLTRDEDRYLCSLYSDYRRQTGDPRHVTSKRTLAALLSRGRHGEKLR